MKEFPELTNSRPEFFKTKEKQNEVISITFSFETKHFHNLNGFFFPFDNSSKDFAEAWRSTRRLIQLHARRRIGRLCQKCASGGIRNSWRRSNQTLRGEYFDC